MKSIFSICLFSLLLFTSFVTPNKENIHLSNNYSDIKNKVLEFKETLKSNITNDVQTIIHNEKTLKLEKKQLLNRIKTLNDSLVIVYKQKPDIKIITKIDTVFIMVTDTVTVIKMKQRKKILGVF